MSEDMIIKITEDNFKSIKHTDENSIEFWYARELQTILGYTE